MNSINHFKTQCFCLKHLFIFSWLLISTNTFAQSTNPTIPADIVVECQDDGSKLAKIFLCGSSASRLISTSFINVSSVNWEKLNENSCAAVTNSDCPNKTNTCSWSLIFTGTNFTVATAGQYRIRVVNNDSSQNYYYFNVYQNGLDIPFTKTDIYCGKVGDITVAQLTGYEYSLDGTTYQKPNIFSIATAGDYTVKVRRIGANPTDCVFEIPVTIVNKELDVVTTVTQPTISGEKGTIKLTTTNVREHYFYKITQGATLINEVGPILNSEYSFPNLNAGTYTWSVKTNDCNWKSGDVTINAISKLIITPTVQPITCQPGSIQVVVTGGTAPYQYFFNGNTTPTSDLIPVSLSGDYPVKVIDNNGLTDQITVIVPLQSAPIYTIEKSNLNCYYPNSWQIKFNVSNYNGNAVKFSINNGVTFSDNPIFNGLSATPVGTIFKTIIEYSYGGVKCTKSEDVTLVQPQYGLSATAGVSELIGCISTDLDKAKIRITNPQGGTPPYQYSFDNQATWTMDNFSLQPAGKHVFFIKDSKGCLSALPSVTVENIGVPDVSINNLYNCDGSANSSVAVATATSTSFNYTYSLDGGPFVTSNNFSNIPSGNHTLTVNYQPLIVPTFSNLLKEDFGYGADTTSPGMSALYCFERQVVATQCKGSILIQDGDYSVTSKIISPYGAWYSPKDNTPPTSPVTTMGRFLTVNVNATLDPKAILYEKTIADIIPNQPIIVEFYVTNLLRKAIAASPPNLTIALVDKSGTEISTINTGDVPRNELWNKYPVASVSLNPGNNTSLRFIVRNNNPNGGGNDLAIDDISAYQIPKLCAATKTINFTVLTGKAFDASIIATKNSSCAGLSNGEITIAAQNFNSTTGYQYSKDNGTTWQTVMTSPFTISGLGEGTYAIKVRYNAIATGVCIQSFSPITITVPTPLVTTANVTNLATCSRGATITANSNGGTPFYQYELWEESNTTKMRSVQNSEIFDNVPPAKYTLRGLDANGCGNNTPVRITVEPPSNPDPTLDSSSDLCYDAVNQATIKINVTTGIAPFSFSLDGGALQNSEIFTNVGPGTHVVEVIASNNCKAITQDIKIGNELKVAAILTKVLDCTSSPDAIIKVTIDGGLKSIRYRVFKNGIKISPNDIPIADISTSLMYVVNATQVGSYSFEIIDANGCSITTNSVVVSPKTTPKILSIIETQSISCNGFSTAIIKPNLDFTKGVAPFTYAVKNTTSNTLYGNTFSGLPAGNYEVTVTDSNSCSEKSNTTISEPKEIKVTHRSVDITCNQSTGVSKGSVIVEKVTGGIPPYNYFVTGVNGYNEKETNTRGDTSYTFDVVDFGLYQINVVDAKGCSVLIQDVKVASPPNDLDITVATTTVNCSTGGEATVSIGNATNITSSGPFYFAIYKPVLVYNPTDISWKLGDTTKSTIFTGLLPGVKYTFVVYDQATGCYYYETAETAIKTNSTLEVSNLVSKNISCKGSADGKVTFTVKNQYSTATPISYQVYNSQSLVPVPLVSGSTIIPANSSSVISNLGDLPFGNYFVLIKEESGALNQNCSVASDTFNITESAIDLTVSATVLKNINCKENGVISVQAKDGTAPYQYQISALATIPSSPIGTGPIPPPPPSATGIWGITNSFTVDQVGNYTVWVKDAYGCEKTTSVIIAKDPEPVIGLSILNQCVNEGKFEIQIQQTTAGIEPYYLSVNGSVFNPAKLPTTLSNQNSGNYIISVKDVNGCTNSQPLLIHSPLGLSSTFIKQPTCVTHDGEIKAIALGGSGDYEYKIDSGIYGSIFNFSGLSSGAHTIYIKDTSTLCEKNSLVNLEAPTAVTGLNLSQKPVSCHGENDGSIIATIATPVVGINDNPIYTYSLNGEMSQRANIFSGLVKGTYTVDVISGRGCVASTTISVTEPAVITLPAPTVIEFGCNSTNNLTNASITVSGVLGGSGTYIQYEFIKNGTRVQFGVNPTYIETDLNGGSYTINVYDDKGCSGSTLAPVTIQPFYILDQIIVKSINPISCAGSETIQVSVMGIGGMPTNIEYSINPISGSLFGTTISSNTTGIFTGLTVGEYLITVKNTVTNCTLQEVYTINEPNTFDLTIESVVDVTCFGGANGSVNITLIDSNLPRKAGVFSFTIKDSLNNPVGTTETVTNAGPISILGLKADIYSITATLINFPFCSVTKNFTISQPTSALVLSESHSNITCTVGNNDGIISALPTGGWSILYEYKWEKDGIVVQDWSDVNELTNLNQGTYIVYSRDARGCEVYQQVVLKKPTPITLTAITDKYLLECFADRNATIAATNVFGGQGSNYSYTLNRIAPNSGVLGNQISNEFKNVVTGTYTITVNDNWSCTATSSQITIREPNNVVATLSLLTPATCSVAAQFDLNINGGTSPYSISTDNINYSPHSSTILNGNSGTNHYFVKDSQGCGSYLSNDIFVEPPKTLTVVIDATFAKVNCKGDNSAAILATVQGGLGIYTYSLLDDLGNTLRPAQPMGTFADLPAGKYKVRVTSLDCVPGDSEIISILEPIAKLKPIYSWTDVLCAGTNSGKINLNTTGGTAIIKQAISPNLSQFTESMLFENLAAGNYDLVVQDALGCYEKHTVTIAEPLVLSAQTINTSIVQELCYEGKNAQFSIAISGGTLPYNVAIDNLTGPYKTGTINQTQFDFTNLSGGSHTVYIKDANNCNLEWNVILNESVKISPTTSVNYECVSNAQHNLVTVSLDTTITDFKLVQFALDEGTYQSSNLFTNLSPGDHFIRVKHTNGCIKDTPIFPIKKIEPLTLTVKEGGLNEIIAVPNGGGGKYKYTFNGEINDTNPSYVFFNTQDILVTVEDANGCITSVTQKFNFIDICITNYFTPNGDGINDTWAPGCTQYFKDLTFSVLDRYGREIGNYHFGESWDGKYQGVELPSGDYWYVLKLNARTDDREFVGHFTLYR